MLYHMAQNWERSESLNQKSKIFLDESIFIFATTLLGATLKLHQAFIAMVCKTKENIINNIWAKHY